MAFYNDFIYNVTKSQKINLFLPSHYTKTLHKDYKTRKPLLQNPYIPKCDTTPRPSFPQQPTYYSLGDSRFHYQLLTIYLENIIYFSP